MMKFLMLQKLFDVADAGGGGGGSDPAPVADPAPGSKLLSPAAQPPQGDPPAGGQGSSPSAYAPPAGLDIPQHLIGKDADETLAKIAAAYKGARGKIGEIPATAAEYTFEWVDEVKPFADSLKDDPLMKKAVPEAAHRHGLSKQQANGFINDVLKEFGALGVMEAPYDPQKEMAALFPDEKDAGARVAKTDALVRENKALLAAWAKEGLDPAAVKYLDAALDFAGANKAVQFFAERMGGEVRPAGGGAPRGVATEADLKKRQADPRAKWGSPDYDQTFVDETNRLYQQVYS